MEGTTKMLYKFGLESSDVIIHLRYKNIFILWFFLFNRSLLREKETLKGLYKLMRHSLYKKHHLGYRKGKQTPEETIEPYKYKVITLSSFKEIDDFIDLL